MPKKTTIYDIAAQAGVSISSVSRVLSNHPNVRPELRAKVLEIVERNHYLPGTMPQGLSKGDNTTIGIVMPPVDNPYYASLFCEADRAVREQGCSTWLEQLPPNNHKIEDGLVDRLIQRRFAGILLAGGFSDDETRRLRKAVARLRNYMPVVLICAPIPDLGCLCFHNDVVSAIVQSVTHLHTLGHTRIAFLGGPFVESETTVRGKAFLHALSLHGLDYPTAYGFNGGYDAQSGALALLNLWSKLGSTPPPTAIICFNDLVALGAIQQLNKLGLQVPLDVAVIGCDNSFFAQYTNPPLTTIDLYAEKTARHAMQVLLKGGDASDFPTTQTLEATLVIRESCGIKLGHRHL